MSIFFISAKGFACLLNVSLLNKQKLLDNVKRHVLRKYAGVLIIVSAKQVSRKDAKTAKKTGGGALRPLREMAQTKIKACDGQAMG